MSPSLTRCQFAAFGVGILLCGALLGASALLRPVQERLDHLDCGVLSMALNYGIGFAIPAAFAFAMAVYAGRHERVALITCAIPALLIFLIGYLFDINTKIESEVRHAMVGGVLGYRDPLDIVGQSWKFFQPMAWFLVAGGVGIGLKRWAVRKKPQGKDAENADRAAPFQIFLGVLAGLILAGVISYAMVVAARNTPEGRLAQARKVLASPGATEARKQAVLWDVWKLRSDAATAILRDAMQNQPHPLNVLAAAFLASRNDISGLPLLEREFSGSPGRVQVNFGAMISRIDNPEAIPALGRWMKSSDPQIRRGAAQALSRMENQKAFKSLIEGLDDADWEVRWASCRGLSRLTGPGQDGKSWSASREQFQNNEQLYLEHWKEWVKSYQAGAELP